MDVLDEVVDKVSAPSLFVSLKLCNSSDMYFSIVEPIVGDGDEESF